MSSSGIRAHTRWCRNIEKSLFRHLKRDALEEQVVGINDSYLREFAACLQVETSEHFTFEMVKENIDSLRVRYGEVEHMLRQKWFKWD